MYQFITRRFLNVLFRREHKLSGLYLILLLHLPELISTECSWIRTDGNQQFVCQDEILEMLKYNENVVVFGGSNNFYKIRLDFVFQERGEREERMTWNSNLYDKQMCLLKWKLPELCNNYIRIYDEISDDHILLCGTHSLKPLCRVYKRENDQYKIIDEYSAEGICGHKPFIRGTAVVIDKEIFAATYEQESDVHPVIQRKPVKTEDMDELNEAVFVGSFRYGNFVYFFFREAQVRLNTEKKIINSKVARVCINDKGYKVGNVEKWTSYFKSSLICSRSGIEGVGIPVDFNQIQAISNVVKGDSDLFYAVFNPDPEFSYGSALCVFSMKDIQNVFDGDFRELGNKGPVSSENVPNPRPGTCSNSSGISEQLKKFLLVHNTMNNPVKSYSEEPVIVNDDESCRYTSIFVDPQVRSSKDKTYDILYIGTECGTVIKALRANSEELRVVETLKVSPSIRSVKGLYFHLDSLLVYSNDTVLFFDNYRCQDRAKNCHDCISLRDPNCVWFRKTNCLTIFNFGDDDYLQDVENGDKDVCCPDAATHIENVKSLTYAIVVFYFIFNPLIF